MSRLFLADNVTLFSEASHDQVDVIKGVLDEFCGESGQRVSYSKSLLYVSANVSQQKVRGLSNSLGIPLTDNLSKYLGMPIV